MLTMMFEVFKKRTFEGSRASLQDTESLYSCLIELEEVYLCY